MHFWSLHIAVVVVGTFCGEAGGAMVSGTECMVDDDAIIDCWITVVGIILHTCEYFFARTGRNVRSRPGTC